MAIIHFSLVLTIIATVCQTIAVFLPSWLRFISSFAGEVQIGVMNFCIEWKCQRLDDLDFTALDILPEEIKRLFGQLIIPPLLLMFAECTALAVLCCSVILASVSLCVKKKARLIKVHLGMNVASGFIIMCGVSSTVTLGGDFRIINTLGDFLKVFNITFKATYSYSFYLAVTAAGLSLFSGILCCCIDETNGRNTKHRKSSRRSSSGKSSERHSKKENNDSILPRHHTGRTTR